MKNIALKESLEIAKLHLARAKFSYEQFSQIKLDKKIFQDSAKVQIIDAFMLRFIKLQDIMGFKLFKNLLEATGSYRDDMSMLDVLDKLEKLKLISSSDEWFSYRRQRNQITHEYPSGEESTLDGIKIAIAHFSKMEKILLDIEKYVEQRKLI